LHAEQKFKEITEAYSVLTDPKKKHRFDMGEDLDESETGFGPDVDMSTIFEMFNGQGFGGFPGGFPGGGRSRGGGRTFQFGF